MPTITRFSKNTEYIGVNVDYPFFKINGDQKVKSITIHRFFGRPYNWYDNKDYYEYTHANWNKLVKQIEQDAKKYGMEVVNKDEQGGYAYMVPIWKHTKRNPPVSYSVTTKSGKTYKVTRDIDPEYMRKIGKRGYAVTEAKLKLMMNDPNADPDDVMGLLKFLHRRIRLSTDTYRKLYKRVFNKGLKQGKSAESAHDVASKQINELWMSRKAVENPIESYISEATAIIRDDPRYRGHFIVATGFMVRQCKVIFKKKTIRVYALSSPEMKHKIDKAAFAFKNENIRDIMLNKLLTKVKNKYIIKRVKDKWYFDKIDKKDK